MWQLVAVYILNVHLSHTSKPAASSGNHQESLGTIKESDARMNFSIKTFTFPVICHWRDRRRRPSCLSVLGESLSSKRGHFEIIFPLTDFSISNPPGNFFFLSCLKSTESFFFWGWSWDVPCKDSESNSWSLTKEMRWLLNTFLIKRWFYIKPRCVGPTSMLNVIISDPVVSSLKFFLQLRSSRLLEKRFDECFTHFFPPT